MNWQLKSRASQKVGRRSSRNIRERHRRVLGLERLESRKVMAAFTPGNLLVSSSPADEPSMLYEFTTSGLPVQSTEIPHPSIVISERARDVVLDSNGNATVFNRFGHSVLPRQDGFPAAPPRQ